MSRRALAATLLFLIAARAVAAPVLGTREDLRFDRPEAWAMAFAASSLLFHGNGGQPMPRAALQLGAEVASVPHLSVERRRVGLVGTKLEDLNKTPAVGRLRARLGLGDGFALELGWTPPVTIDGATPRRMLAIAFDSTIPAPGSARASARLSHQAGSVHGDISCDRDTAARPAGSAGNPFGCARPSRDRYSMRATGFELGIGWDGNTRARPWLAVAWHRLHAQTQLDAQVFTVRDRSLLRTRGTLATATIGLALPSTGAWQASAALGWTPLDVRRPGGLVSDDFWSMRLVLARRLR